MNVKNYHNACELKKWKKSEIKINSSINVFCNFFLDYTQTGPLGLLRSKKNPKTLIFSYCTFFRFLAQHCDMKV